MDFHWSFRVSEMSGVDLGCGVSHSSLLSVSIA